MVWSCRCSRVTRRGTPRGDALRRAVGVPRACGRGPPSTRRGQDVNNARETELRALGAGSETRHSPPGRGGKQVTALQATRCGRSAKSRDGVPDAAAPERQAKHVDRGSSRASKRGAAFPDLHVRGARRLLSRHSAWFPVLVKCLLSHLILHFHSVTSFFLKGSPSRTPTAGPRRVEVAIGGGGCPSAPSVTRAQGPGGLAPGEGTEQARERSGF